MRKSVSTLLEERITKEESMQFPGLFEPYVYNPKIRTNHLYLDKILRYAGRRDNSGNDIIDVLNDLDVACSQCNSEYVTAIQARELEMQAAEFAAMQENERRKSERLRAKEAAIITISTLLVFLFFPLLIQIERNTRPIGL